MEGDGDDFSYFSRDWLPERRKVPVQWKDIVAGNPSPSAPGSEREERRKVPVQWKDIVARNPSPSALGSEREISAIVITGFPDDMRSRELRILLLFLDGFEASQLYKEANPPYGIGFFSRREQAIAAIGMINGMQFDLSNNVSLRAQIATHSLIHRTGTSTSSSYNSSVLVMPSLTAAVPNSSAAAAPSSSAAPCTSQTRGPFPPSSTLFLGHFRLETTEAELQAIRERFQSEVGYRYMDTQHRLGDIVCFVRFDTIDNAMRARNRIRRVTDGSRMITIRFAADRG